MLRKVLMVIGGLCLLGAIIAITTGHGRDFVPQLIAGAVIFGLGVALERWRYKPIHPQRVEPGWQDTGERFVDPETNQSTAVYFDPRTGERHYVAQGTATKRK
ncbi:MAG TPA: hypothetical protein VF269_07540 [Rhodanobacteraceae bacterium]